MAIHRPSELSWLASSHDSHSAAEAKRSASSAIIRSMADDDERVCADRGGAPRGPRTTSLEDSAMAGCWDLQAAATGSRPFTSASALSIVLVAGVAPSVIWTVLGFF